MSGQCIKTVLALVGLLLVACSQQDDPLLAGSPTRLKPGETPVDVICRIQAAFKALPKPLMERMSYKGAWTSYHLGAAPVRHRGFYRIHLRQEAMTFLKKHSRLELVASLVPLFIEPDVGGEAAVLLAGIPVGSDSLQGYHTGTLAGELERSRYKSPAQPGSWYDTAYQQYPSASALYGLTNTSENIHKKYVSGYAGSLEHEIVKLLKDYSQLPLQPLEGDYLHVPQPHHKEAVEKWLSDQLIPVLKSKSRRFVDNYQANFAGISLLPLIPSPGSLLNAHEVYMMWLLRMEKEYWPALLNFTTGLKLQGQLPSDFRREAIEKLVRVCLPVKTT